jgi:Ca2+-binding EF-hand superfamily protein
VPPPAAPPVAAKPVETPVEAVASQDVKPVVAEAEKPASADSPAETPKEVAADSVKPETVVAADDKQPEAAPATEAPAGQSKRMLLYTPSGPLIVEFVLRVDGKGAVEMNDAFVDQLLKVADTDNDGKTTWMEALSNQRSGIPQFIGQAGNAQEFYDRNKDGAVDRGELWNLLGHGDAGLAFRLEHYDGPGGATTAAEVAKLLDVDADGVLTLEEIDRAPAQLRLADVDDDERLSPGDLGAPDMRMPQLPMDSGYTGSVVTTASMLDTETDWGVVQFELDQRYLMHGQFRDLELPLFPELAKKLDADENGILAVAEAEILNYLSPHVRIELEFGADVAGAARLKVTDLRTELASAAQSNTERSARLDWPNLTLAFSIADATAQGGVAAQADAIFMQADADKNGYLEEDELPEERKSGFKSYDANADGKLYPDELKAALDAERTPLLNRVRAVVTPGEHSLLAAIDANRDGALSLREIQEASKKLREADRDGDGRLTRDEIPTRISVHFERGMGGDAAPAATYETPGDPTAPKDAPVWFRRMDHNADGDISPREFLGSPETFKRLDQDADGLLSLSEAVAKSEPAKDGS